MHYRETDPRVLAVLERALGSNSRVTRLRAVAMLANVECGERSRWLDSALADGDSAVSQTAACVLAWVAEPSDEPWPRREDPRFDRVAGPPSAQGLEEGPDGRWRWEYVVEIWRDDGLLVGAYLVPTCEEDDDHAKRIALGQAVIASASRGADAFEPGSAAAFIVGKRGLSSNALPPGWPRRRPEPPAGV